MALGSVAQSRLKWLGSSLALLLLLILATLQAYYSLHDYGLGFASTVGLVSLVCWLTAAALWNHRLGRCLSWLLIVLLYLNIVLSDISFSIYGYGFNVGFAYSVWNSDFNESAGFLSLYWFRLTGLFVGFVALILSCAVLSSYAAAVNRRIVVGVGLVLLLAVGWSGFNCHKASPYRWLECWSKTTPLYNFSYFFELQSELDFIQQLSQLPPPQYSVQPRTASQAIYVLVIGESARRAKLSLYGYSRPTSPNMDKRRSQLWVAQQAIAPAPITVFSVPASLSRLNIEDLQAEQVTDNLISLANQAGLATYWFSRQGQIGQFNNLISVIAKQAQHTKWLKNGYDADLLPYVQQAIQEVKPNQDKLIVLHINGSHEPACGKYPSEFDYFGSGLKYDDCYDNSVRYTDALLESILQLLAGHNASLLYFSDHGLERDATSRYLYFHGGKKPSKMAYDVPLFIWYGQDNPHRGQNYQSPYSTAGLYPLMQDWLGIRVNTGAHSPLAAGYQAQLPIKVMDAERAIYWYNELPADFVRQKLD